MFQEALSQSEQAQRQWDLFKAEPIRFSGEHQARAAVDAAIAANKVTGERVGVAALSSTPDPALIALLEAEQATSSSQVFDAFERLQSDFYKPAATAALGALHNQVAVDRRGDPGRHVPGHHRRGAVDPDGRLAGVCGSSVPGRSAAPARRRWRPRTPWTPSSSTPWT